MQQIFQICNKLTVWKERIKMKTKLPVNRDTVEISAQNNSMGKESESRKTELGLNHPKTIPEYEQRLKRMEKLLLQSGKSRKIMAIQMRKIKIKLNRLQEVRMKLSTNMKSYLMKIRLNF